MLAHNPTQNERKAYLINSLALLHQLAVFLLLADLVGGLGPAAPSILELHALFGRTSPGIL